MEVNKPIVIKPGELRCPRCFGKDVAPVVRRGLWIALMVRLGRIPKDCRFCGKRFYVPVTKEKGG